MLRIGLTGGIGSGKTTVAAIFEVLGIPVYYADKSAQRLMNEDPLLKNQITELLGEECYKNGQLDKSFVREQIFNDDIKRTRLNQLVHPITIQDAAEWMKKQRSPYAIKEAALVFESHSEHELDFVIGVEADEQTRMERVVQRDQITILEAKQRMASQMNEKEKLNRCDFIINNDDQHSLIEQVIQLHHKLLGMN